MSEDEGMLRRLEAVEQELRALRDYVQDMVDQLHDYTRAQRRRFDALTDRER